MNVLAHVAVALERYLRELRTDGITPPRELVALLMFLKGCGAGRETSGEPAQRSLLTKREAAHQLGVSVRTLERLARTGQLRTVAIGGAVRVRPTDIQDYVSTLERRTA